MFWRTGGSPIAVVKKWVRALNAHDEARVIELLHPDCRFVDSQGFAILGRENGSQAIHALMSLEPHFQMHVESYARHNGKILMQGHTTADDPRLARHALWLGRVKDGKLCYLQSFAQDNPPALSMILLPEKALHLSAA